MLKPLKLLLVDDSPDDCELLLLEVRRGGYDPVWARVDTATSMLAKLNNQPWDIVIGDYHMPRFNEIRALKLLRAHWDDTPFVMVSGCISDEAGRRAMRNGARDYIMKNNLSRLVPTIEREIFDAEQHRRQRQLEREMQKSKMALEIARRIQQQLLPTSAPYLRGFDIAGAAYPADATGGDYFDYFPMADASLTIAIGDACGHGVGPALLMAQARTCLHTLIVEQKDISDILAGVNRILYEATPQEHFMTLLLARLDPTTRQLSYTSAGHAGCVVNSAGDIRATLGSTGFPLGLVADARFLCAEPVDLEPEDVVLLTTDGITEARSPDGDLFGLQRAINLVRIYQSGSAFDIVNNLFHAVRAFTQISPQDDDITTVVIKVNDVPASTEKDSHS